MDYNKAIAEALAGMDSHHKLILHIRKNGEIAFTEVKPDDYMTLEEAKAWFESANATYQALEAQSGDFEDDEEFDVHSPKFQAWQEAYGKARYEFEDALITYEDIQDRLDPNPVMEHYRSIAQGGDGVYWTLDPDKKIPLPNAPKDDKKDAPSEWDAP